jgi:hypothetical protein
VTQGRSLLLPLVLAAGLLSACTAPGARPVGPPLRNAVHRAPRVPDAADHAAADLAAAALVRDVAALDQALAALQEFDAGRETPTGLEPAALVLRGAALESGRRHRHAVEALLERDDLDPALRRRLEHQQADDPLVRAEARVRDARRISVARAFNTVAEPVGRSLLTTALAPVRLGRAVLRYALDLYQRDPLPLQRRQALAHWKDFLARYPNAPERERVELQVHDAQVRWRKTRREQALDQAEAALDVGRHREALVLADRALRYSPEHPGAEQVRTAAAEQIEHQRRSFRESERFTSAASDFGDETRKLALAVLLPSDASWLALDDVPPTSANAEAAAFAELTLRAGANQEHDHHDGLVRLAALDAETHPMARHARAALADPRRNPHDLFRAARARDRWQRTAWIFFGPLAERPPKASIEGALQTLVDFPGVIQAGMTLPLRILQWPWMPPPATAKVTALQARRYLVRHPQGVHRDEVLGWLARYEGARNNHVGALRLAEQREPGGDHDALREQAASQAFRVALGEQRRDVRQALLAGVSRRFPTTEAGDEAGRLVRIEAEEHTPQRIEISRGFLEENPEVAGPDGLDLDPALLDGNPSNGELHDDGIAWIGGRVIELAYVAASGDPDDEADRQTFAASDERLRQLVSRLEETSFRNALLDDDDPVIPDAERDLAFERARLGITKTPGVGAAPASFAYRGMRERYGVVRRREPILPFDIVVQGNLSDLSLGAFPRLREPKKTEDAPLYE